MYQFEIYRLFCKRYINGGAEQGRILNINEFLNHFKTCRMNKHILYLNYIPAQKSKPLDLLRRYIGTI